MVSTNLNYRLITRDLDRSLSNTARQPVVKRESEYYLANITKVKSMEDFLGNQRLYSYAMKAFGLEDMTYAKAFMRKVLTEGIDSNDSFANQLTDKRYREFAETFNFKSKGQATTAFDRTQQGTVDRYVRQTLEEDAGEQNEGVRLALYFQRKAPEITSVYSLLGDQALYKVIQTAFSIPASASTSDIDKLAAQIGKRLDIADLKDPKKLDQLLNRFTSLYELENPSFASAGNLTVQLFQSSGVSISADLLASIQKLRLGG